ncbi:putative glucan endo-1,3-beta-glucosidase eglC [Cladobotryum mycophilum]|uniref:Probable glucan endo-1,3-beta-glucosidase eglC n=1 Tax=Cladobotryum mycophilum TaxID=491253 RepID=A0ABR0T1I3_9HYPO
MPSSSSLLSLATAFTAANAAYQGFNYGATFTDGRVKVQTDFEAEFKNAAGLEGTDGGFTSARLYTMIQGGTGNQPISAIPAAINTKTSLLFGLWASAGDAAFADEIAALKNTIDQYCDKLDGLVAGISVGSEDLYRVTPIGQASKAGPGAEPETLVKYVKQVRDTIKGSCLEHAPIGHVDTWTAYVEGSNKILIDNLDWLGMDTYPYFENTNANSIQNGKSLYESALGKVQAVSGGKDIYITETGWPVSGPNSGAAIASVQDAQTYWQQVGCPNFGKVNIWWYTMQDAAPTTPSPSFGLIGPELTTKPIYDLSCKDVKPAETSTSAASKPTSSKGAATTHGSGSGSHTTSGSDPAATSVSEIDSSALPTVLPTTLATAPFPTTNGTVVVGPSGTAPGSGPGSNPGSGAGSPTGGNGAPSTTPIHGNSGSQLNSFGAAAVALVLAALAL